MRNDEERVIVKGTIPRSLKLQFKVLCIEKELEMSRVLECLITRWIQTDVPILNISTLSGRTNGFAERFVDIKGYIPESLKIDFKVRCAQRRIKIRSVLHELINEWVQTGGFITAECPLSRCSNSK